MPDDKDKIHAPWTGGDDQAETASRGLTTGGLGSGGVSNDTGGLDAAGNELGAVAPGTSHGPTEQERIDVPIEDAHTRQ